MCAEGASPCVRLILMRRYRHWQKKRGFHHTNARTPQPSKSYYDLCRLRCYCRSLGRSARRNETSARPENRKKHVHFRITSQHFGLRRQRRSSMEGSTIMHPLTRKQAAFTSRGGCDPVRSHFILAYLLHGDPKAEIHTHTRPIHDKNMPDIISSRLVFAQRPFTLLAQHPAMGASK